MTRGYHFLRIYLYRKSPHLWWTILHLLAFTQNTLFVTAWAILIHLESPLFINPMYCKHANQNHQLLVILIFAITMYYFYF